MSDTALPFVTVIMPIRNEGGFIARSLAAVLAQDYPAERLEVLVADGMSTDSTRTVVAELAARHPNVRLIDNPGKIVPTGLNRALAEAQGAVIVRVDGHTLLAPDYVTECVRALARSGADNVGGKMQAIGAGAVGRAVALATGSPFGVGNARFHYSDQEEWVDTVYLGAWPRQVCLDLGPFDEELVRNQDDEFNYRLRSRGGRILLTPQIRSVYTPRDSLRALARQYYQYGYWKVRVLQKHPRQMSARQFAPPLLVGALLGLGALAPRLRAARWALAGVVGAYLSANGAASLWTAHRHGRQHLPLLPVVFATLHGGYGLGFLVGLVRFWNHWRRTEFYGNPVPTIPPSRATDG